MLLSHRPTLSRALAFAVLCLVVVSLYNARTIQSHLQPTERVLPTTIPRHIWYKLGPKGLSDDAKKFTDGCLSRNPHYGYTFMTDETGDRFVRETFAHRPDLVEAFVGLRVPILKADWLRYLLLYSEGGLWLDLDVECMDLPIDQWVAPEYQPEAGVVAGWEFDVGWEDPILRQFNSWTILAKPRVPHMWAVVEDILADLHRVMREHNVTRVEGVRLDMVGDVVDFTGPRRFTNSVLKSVGESLNMTQALEHDNQNLTNLLQPKLIGDLLILPGYAFSPGSNTYSDEQKKVIGPTLVAHHYAGSWKNDKGGED